MDVYPMENRREPFFDDFLIEKTDGDLIHRLGTPESCGPALTFDRPWEGSAVTYCSLVQDGRKALLYYRGLAGGRHIASDHDDGQVTCVAVSEDGESFVRLPMNLFLPEYPGNNVILKGSDAHNFAPFLDTNPAADPEQKYKAVAGEGVGENHGLKAYFSPDGLHWNCPDPRPMITEGQFDSHNIAFYDEAAGLYRCYCRYWAQDGLPTGGFTGYRAIHSVTSADFRKWTGPIANTYDKPSAEHFYTNATVPCPGAEHILLSFPMRLQPDRKRNPDWPEKAISDCVFMSSRDGVFWNRTVRDAFIRAGHDPLNWGDRSQIMTRGLYVHPDGRISMYLDRRYHTDGNYLERLTVRPEGFLSVHGSFDGGRLLTKPLRFGRGQLYINAATGAYGSVQVLVRDTEGNPIPGFGEESPLWYGDAYSEAYPFRGDISALAEKTVRLEIRLMDADLYSIQFR